MLIEKMYDRERALAYARRWALDRNPLFENYAGMGGDCTNFVSQVVYAGGCTMNYTPTFGWYYRSPTDRTPSWTGVQFFYDFLTQNEGVGPFGEEVNPGGLTIGDVIQLGRADGTFYHALVVTGFENGTYLVGAHTDDAFDRPLDTYRYAQARFLRIRGVRIEVPDTEDCFENLINGISL